MVEMKTIQKEDYFVVQLLWWMDT